MNLFKLGVNAAFVLRRYGIRVVRAEDPRSRGIHRDRQTFLARAQAIYNRHLSQTIELTAALDRKYEAPVLGKMAMWDAIALLGRCVDSSDPALYCVSQLVHSMQVLSAMEDDGIEDRDLLLVALIHDLGKILLITGEAEENVVCGNAPIGRYDDGIGLDHCVLQWNHDRFLYLRLRDLVPDHVAWLLRYHSISVPECERLMDARDRQYTERYLRVFQKYDKGSKSIYRLPTVDLEKYRALIEDTFPKPIAF